MSIQDKLARIVCGMDRGITPTQIDKILVPALCALKSVTLEGTDQSLQKNIIQSLSQLDSKIQSTRMLTEKKIEKIHNSVLLLKKEMLTHKIDLIIAYVSTSSNKDHNGVFNLRIQHLISEKIPFIATRSILCGADALIHKRKQGKWGNESKPPVLDEGEWEVFTYTEEETRGELVICIPKELFGGVKDLTKLAKLDLKTDGSLKQITVREAYAGPVGSNHFQDFVDLFTNTPQKTKMFYIMGHGNIGEPAGMALGDYVKFLKFCTAQHCRGMIMLSCYSGGESSLIPTMISQKEQESLTFPIAMQSLGDWVARPEVAHEIPGTLNKMKQLFENPGSLTIPHIRKTLQAMEKKHGKDLQNSFQFIFPHSHHIPGGARPPVEKPSAQAFTMTDLKQAQLTASAQNSVDVSVAIEDKKFLLLFPTVTPLTIIHEADDPIYISMTPGEGKHYIACVDLFDDDPREWIDKFERGYSAKNAYEIGVDKGFFIGKLESGDETISPVREVLEDVAFLYGPSGHRCFYRKNDQHYIYDNGNENPISPFIYATQVYYISKLTTPSLDASQASTAGQQDKNTFLIAIEEAGFYKTAYPPITTLKSLSDLELEQLFDEFEDRNDKIEWLFFLMGELGDSKNALAMKLFEKEKFPSDLESFRGVNFLSLAAVRKNRGLLKFLLEKNADVNIRDPLTCTTPLERAICVGNTAIVKLMLVGVDNIEKNGLKDLRTLLRYAGDEYEIVQLLLKTATEKQKIHLWKAPQDLLRNALLNQNIEIVQLFLDSGADPNHGNPHPLFIAIWYNNIKLVELLLDYGANPFKAVDDAIIPFVDCIKCGTLEMVHKLLSATSTLPMSQNVLNLALIAALEQGNDTLIDLFVTSGAKVCVEHRSKIIAIVEKYENLNDYKYIKKIFQLIPTVDEQEHIAKAVKIPALIYYLIENGILPSSIEKPSPFFFAIKQNDIPMAQALLSARESLIKASTNYPFPLLNAVENASPKMAVFLLNAFQGHISSEKLTAKIVLEALFRENAAILRNVITLVKQQVNPEAIMKHLSLGEASSALKSLQKQGEDKLVRDFIELWPDPREKIEFASIINRPDFYKYLIKEKVLNLNTLVKRYYFGESDNKTTLFTLLYMAYINSTQPLETEEYSNLLLWALKNGGQIDSHMFNEVFNSPTYVYNSVYRSRGGSIRNWLQEMIRNADSDLVQEFLPEILGTMEICIWEAALQRGAEINGTAAIPLYFMSGVVQSVAVNRVEKIKWVVEHGVDVNMYSADSEHPLVHMLEKNDSEELIRYLFEKGAVITSQDSINTAFVYAFANYGPSMVQFLMDQGYEPKTG